MSHHAVGLVLWLARGSWKYTQACLATRGERCVALRAFQFLVDINQKSSLYCTVTLLYTAIFGTVCERDVFGIVGYVSRLVFLLPQLKNLWE